MKIYIGKCTNSAEFYVYDSKGLTFKIFPTYSQAEKYYNKLQDIFNSV